VRNWIARNAKRRNGMQAVFRARQFIHPVTRAELDGIVELWIDAAMRLGERDLRMMNRLVRAQMRRMESCVDGLEPGEQARPECGTYAA
jgi:DSF synthase